MTTLYKRGPRAARRVPYEAPLPCNHDWGKWHSTWTARRFQFRRRECTKCGMVEGTLK